MLCKKCKKEIENDSIYCRFCGKKQVVQQQKHKPKSRGNGTGSVYQLPNKKWKAAVVEYYYRSDNGKLRPKRNSKTFERKNDAINALAELKKQEHTKKAMTLNDLYDIFAQSKKYEKLSRSQQGKLEIAWNRLKPIQLFKISDLSLEIMQEAIDSQKMKDESPVTYYPARDMKVMLSHLFTVAIKHGQETINKTQYIELPDAPTAKRQVFTEEEMAKLWDDYNGQCLSGPCESHEFTGYILMLIYTGMRVGEMYRLGMNDFHMEERYLIGGEKTEAGRDREIAISKAIYPVVKKFYDNGCFPLRNIWKFYDDYKDTIDRLKIRPLPAQTCRHTFFTLMVERKVHPAVIASMGGHAQYETAIDHYNRLPLEEKIKAADKL